MSVLMPQTGGNCNVANNKAEHCVARQVIGALNGSASLPVCHECIYEAGAMGYASGALQMLQWQLH